MLSKSIFLAGAALTLVATAPVSALPNDFKAKADAILKAAYPAAGPGAAVIVTEDGKTVYAAGHGLADVGAKTTIAPETVFRLGSITKQFSAAVMLQLVAEGKVSLDDRLSKFLPDFPKPGADATIAQLLNHTVGVQSYTGIPGWMDGDRPTQAVTTEQLIAEFKDLPAPSKPGEKWDYNNSGYVLVGAVIEKVTGKPWHQAVDERIAAPLGLTSIRYGTLEATVAGMAKGYSQDDKGPSAARSIHMSVPHAAGALIGTVGDLAKWNHALHHGKVVPPALHAQMVAPTKLPDGNTEPYGFGIGRSDVRGREAVGHGGGIFGFSTNSVYLPKDDLFVAVFANSDSPATSTGVVMQRLAALALNDPYPAFEKAAVEPASLEPLFGVYAIKDGERRFFARDAKLFTRRSGGGELEVYTAGNDRFFYGPDNLTWFEVRRNAAGKHVMAMYQNGAAEPELSILSGPIPAEPEVVVLPRAALEALVGTYKASLGLATIAFGEGDALTIRMGGGRAAPLKAISATEFVVDGVDAKVTFKADAGKASGLVINQGGRELAAVRTD